MTSIALKCRQKPLTLSGVIEDQRADRLRAALDEAIEAGGWVDVDLSAVETISPEALDVLRRAADALERTGSRLLIINPSAPAPRVIDFRSIHRHVRIPVEIENGSR